MEKEIDFQEEEEEMNDVDSDLESKINGSDSKGKENEGEVIYVILVTGLLMNQKKNTLKKVKTIDVW